MNQNTFEQEQDDELNLFQAFEKLRDGWRVIFGAFLLCVFGAIALIFVLPEKFEAVSVVQVAQVNGSPVEPTPHAVERMKTPMFQLRAAKVIGDDSWASSLMSSASATSALSIQPIKTAPNLIELKASATTGKHAVAKVEAMVAELVASQKALADPTLARMRNDLTIAKEKLARAEKEMESIGKLMGTTTVKDDRFTRLSLMTSVRLQKEQEIFGQRQAILGLETALAAPATQPAMALEGTFVSDRPVSPKKTLILAVGGLLGLVLGAMLVFFLEAWRVRKQARLAAA